MVYLKYSRYIVKKKCNLAKYCTVTFPGLTPTIYKIENSLLQSSKRYLFLINLNLLIIII